MVQGVKDLPFADVKYVSRAGTLFIGGVHLDFCLKESVPMCSVVVSESWKNSLSLTLLVNWLISSLVGICPRVTASGKKKDLSREDSTLCQTAEH